MAKDLTSHDFNIGLPSEPLTVGKRAQDNDHLEVLTGMSAEGCAPSHLLHPLYFFQSSVSHSRM